MIFLLSLTPARPVALRVSMTILDAETILL